MRKRYTDEQRAQFLAEVRATGETVRVVAARLGVSVSAAYGWVKAGTAAAPRPVFAKVVPSLSSAKPALTIELGGATIRVESGFDVALLRQVISALS